MYVYGSHGNWRGCFTQAPHTFADTIAHVETWMQQSNETLFVGAIGNTTKCYCYVCASGPVCVCVCVEGAVTYVYLSCFQHPLCAHSVEWWVCGTSTHGMLGLHVFPTSPPYLFYIQSISICTVTLAVVVVLTVHELVYCIQCFIVMQYNCKTIRTYMQNKGACIQYLYVCTCKSS